MGFIDKIKSAAEKANSLVCVGLDTDPEKLPAVIASETDSVYRFNEAIIWSTSDLVCAYKPNSAFYEAMGYANFKLIERGMPSEDLLRRVRAYSERRYRGNLADLILPYGFKQPQAKPAFWRLRHFFRPAQVSPRKLLPLFKLVRQQGMLFPQEERPITIDAASIPPDFVSSFRQRRCAQLDCRSCGYCEAIGEQAVTVQPAFREESLQRRAEVSQALNSGSLWGVRPTVRTTRTDGPADV